MCASGTADPGWIACSHGFSLCRATNREGRPSAIFGWPGEEKKKTLVLSRKETYTHTRHYTSRPQLVHTTALFPLSYHSITPLFCMYVPTYAHTRTIKMWRTRRCSGTHAHPGIHEEGQRFEQAPHVTSVHGVSEMPALTPRQHRSWTNLFWELWVLDV